MALFTLMRFQKYAFSLSSKTHRSIRVHRTVLMCFRLSTLKNQKYENDRIARCDVPVEFYVYATDTRACYIFGHPYDMYAFSF